MLCIKCQVWEEQQVWVACMDDGLDGTPFVLAHAPSSLFQAADISASQSEASGVRKAC